MPLGELARLEEIGASTLTRIVGALEDSGLVTRTADPEDRRVALVGVSPAGRRLLHAARSRSDTYLAQRIATLDSADAAVLLQAVDVVERLLGDEA
jgi:DNA-binding MarR family transcriptional regulator